MTGGWVGGMRAKQSSCTQNGPLIFDSILFKISFLPGGNFFRSWVGEWVVWPWGVGPPDHPPSPPKSSCHEPGGWELAAHLPPQSRQQSRATVIEVVHKCYQQPTRVAVVMDSSYVHGGLQGNALKWQAQHWVTGRFMDRTPFACVRHGSNTCLGQDTQSCGH